MYEVPRARSKTVELIVGAKYHEPAIKKKCQLKGVLYEKILLFIFKNYIYNDD